MAINSIPGLERSYVPAVRIELVEKNFIRKIIDFITSFFFPVNSQRKFNREVSQFLRGRVEILDKSKNPTAAKAVMLLQRFLVGSKIDLIDRQSFYHEPMDPALLDYEVHKDPKEYLKEEKERLGRYRVKLLQVMAHEIKTKFPALEETCNRIIDNSAEISVEELKRWVGELKSTRSLAKSKPVVILEQLIALMEFKEESLDVEILSHYIGILQIQEKMTVQALPNNRLSYTELRAMESLTRLLKGQKGEARDYKRINRFLEALTGNLEMNRRILKFADSQIITSENLFVSKAAAEMALDLSFKLSQKKDYLRVMKKVEVLKERLRINAPTIYEERLNLKEVKKLESLSRLHEKFLQLEAIGTPLQDELVASAVKANAFVKEILERAEKERPHKSGSCVLYDYTNADAYLNWSRTFLHRILPRLIKWPIVHAALAVSHQEGLEGAQNWFSHMYYGHRIFHRRSIGDYSFKTFEVDFSKCISMKGKELLQQRLGDDWEKTVEGLYGEIVHDIHTNEEQLSKFYNPSIKRVLAAISIGYGLFDNHALEHRPLSKQQICSSFVLNTTLAALIRLEERLKETCKRGADAPPLPANFRFIDLPIQKNRVIDFIMPHQLSKTIPFTREVGKPPVIQQILNYHEFDMSP